MNYVTLDEVMNQLGIEKRKSSTLESMTKDEILNMTPEQAKRFAKKSERDGVGQTITRRLSSLPSLM